MTTDVAIEDIADQDLTPWHESANPVPTNLAELPRMFGLQAEDFKYVEIDNLIRLASEGSKEALNKVNCLKAKFIGLMRLDSGLEITTDPVSDWKMSDLQAPNWGNPVTPSLTRAAQVAAAQAAGGGTENLRQTVTPSPGWFYRQVAQDDNWLFMLPQILFWAPYDTGDLMKVIGNIPDVIKQRQETTLYKSAMEMIKAMDLHYSGKAGNVKSLVKSKSSDKVPTL